MKEVPQRPPDQPTYGSSNSAKLPVMCCGVLEKMLIAWMVIEDGTKVMPFIAGDDGNKYRVNHCPSCGAHVRDVRVRS